ncbi:VCBS repeat-containing protein [Paraglaciecola sp.]|uniref:FG-GAP repeat domain-containing protein n=1 Tax=Paraglaciecola sp. TaxID=1920173 RepID=UPI0032660E7F
MAATLRQSVSLFFALALTACGGGGSSSNIPPQSSGPTTQQIIDSPELYTATELETALREKILSSYSGLTSEPELTPAISQKVFDVLFGELDLNFYEINPFFIAELDYTSNLSDTHSCLSGGTVTISAGVVTEAESTYTVSYDNCEYSTWRNVVIDGEATTKIFEISEYSSDLTNYFDDIQVSYNGNLYEVTGFFKLISVDNSESTGERTSVFSHQLLITDLSDDSQIINSNQYSFVGDNDYYEAEHIGELYLSEHGVVDVSHTWSYDFTEGYDYFETTTLSALNTVNIEENESGYVLYQVDNDGDGNFDQGAYLGYDYDYYDINWSELTLDELDQLSLPPDIGYSPSFVDFGYTTLDTIEIYQGSYSDPDTDYDDLIVTYQWFINGQLVEGVTGTSLPAELAVYGDEISVTMLVSDGINQVASSSISVVILDSPAQLLTENVPTNTTAGELVEFNVTIEDADLGDDEEQIPIMTSAPAGASIDADGLVTWDTANHEFLLPEQMFIFTFASQDDTQEQLSVDINVTSNARMPLARSGIEVPTSNYSMWVGDFDNDGLNEVASTDSNQRVFLLEENNGSYEQSWMYPFAMPTLGSIMQIIGLNIDDDAQQEILVATEQGISVIDGLDGIASELLTETNYIKSIAAADSDQDGNIEIAYLSSTSEYSSSDYSLKVFDTATGEITEINSSVDDASEIIFANVDADSSLELITNNGLVYDGSDWSNQWFSGTTFGSSLVAAGDLDGDNIDEIIGADNWGDIKVYSAVTKAQLTSMDNFNTCSLNTADSNNDGVDEILVGDCQWGNITGYNLVDSALEEAWQVDMQDHGSKSVMMGDSDNDGQLELHWGTGQSHSGENSFVVADYDSDEMIVKESSVSPQLDSFSTLGWSNDNDTVEGVFFVPSSGSSYDGSVIATLSPEGSVTITDEISSNWDNSYHGDIADFNKDGMDDVFIPTSETYNGSFGVYQLSDLSLHWGIDGDYYDDIGVIQAYDINNDQYEDAVYVNGNTLQSVDVQNQLLIANYSFDYGITDFAITQISNEYLVAVSTNNNLHLLQLNGSTFSEVAYIEQECGRVEFANLDQEDTQELICLDDNSLISFAVGTDSLQEGNRRDYSNELKDFLVNTSSSSEQSIFVLMSQDSHSSYCYYDCQYVLTELDANFNLLWKGTPIIGTPTHRGMRYSYSEEHGAQLLLSTSSTMYWINP